MHGYEDINERWSILQTPETILLSVISLFYGPNDESPANWAAARDWRREEELRRGDDYKKGDFAKICARIVRESLGE